MNPLRMEEFVREVLNEDVGYGDWTTEALVSESHRSQANLIAKRKGVVAGLPVAEAVFRKLDPKVEWVPAVEEGTPVKTGTVLARLRGKTRALLTGERVALNLLQRLSGIATATREVVDQVNGLNCHVLDTRKTTPGLRFLEKYAVKVGRGTNHRFGLSHGIMIKDNHVALAGGLTEAVHRVRKEMGHMVQVEVEADTLDQVREALSLDVDAILLDNMDVDTLRRAVEMIGGRVWTEASGGVTPDTVRAVAETGVNGVSLGWLTHSTPALDISMELEMEEEL
ncbi:carboxylating nicotinate-nucleotide diphosphorylase [Paludifilum halophilum]|uniref:Probable nicotinate-nucleotide pyrophosphorylase [carboxylating] n=1 Tax=Paludifilum halophilum TaxID=1642702 RepID=A0A235B1U9_9BACL|nr:carboxylating nicotinate-nucleotide diphosphorylase [Paludifilum halophilum]OYD06201.1 nicotinate-nucleotide diphosphorylase (carboxylating) [Paludifilum halophilum]